ncbi:CYTH domain protein [Lysobacteraceae bacterium NML120232]|nr:CYTH domain protein [Xanthomonadaceae bacterium NML08-0793]PJK10765.1 CYTH domain protein [Xanthomonadaceae bacterium NML120232]
MAIEIERKFLLASDDWRAEVYRSIDMAQGYLNDSQSLASGAQNSSIRIRLEGEAARLNIKSRQLGASRQEFDYPLPPEDAEALLALCVGPVLKKRRHFVRHQGHEWEIDEFFADNAGLVVAEVELASLDETFAMPAWAGAEVTHLLRYYNLNLTTRPFSVWSEAERRATDAHGENTCL